MSVSTLQAMAASLSKVDGEYPYKVIGATLLSEVFKLAYSLVMLCLEVSRTRDPLQRAVALNYTRRSVTMAAVPGVAYQMLNNLNFVTLYYVDAPTFQILGNLKIVATGIAGVILLNRHMSRGKWLALVLLTLGAATSQVDTASACRVEHRFEGRLAGYLSAITCVFLSATMGVFTEMYMKGNRASIHFQNLQLYAFGIAANLAALLLRDEIGPRASSPLLHGFNGWAVVTVLTNGGCGLAVSFLLRYADSIAKTYATALTIPCTAIVARLFLSTPISIPNILGSGVMLISLSYFYKGDQLFLSKQKKADPAAPGADDRASAVVVKNGHHLLPTSSASQNINNNPSSSSSSSSDTHVVEPLAKDEAGHQ
ncbi:hypothetical protein CTAYLR_008630 [Chrysophaeum taylorii]|uniref:UDP-galactose transporter n=1 Tax=Chrysophaeum taylorii TaxID=2483200 RepID=A0AAD7UK45_9STRA|nr:hypothetical protein CTAYLR_008630 [Chrysophaeum taylorii]